MNYVIVCYTHETPLVKVNPDIIFWLDDNKSTHVKHDRCIIVKEKYFDLDFFRPQLLGSAGPIAACRFFSENPLHNAEKYSIVQISYRKIVTNAGIGRSSNTYPGMKLIHESEEIDTNLLLPKKDGILVANPIHLGTTIHQYAICHKIPDLLRYAALTVELGILSDQDCIEFLNFPYLFPGGSELGALPYPIWNHITLELEKVNLEFCTKHIPTSLDPHQRRAVSFCSERLSSFLLFKKFKEIYGRNFPPEIFGHITTVVNMSDYTHNTH